MQPKQLRYNTGDDDMYNVQHIEEFPYVADIQRDVAKGDYLDVYIEQDIDANYVNFYPTVNKDATVKAHIVVDYQPVTDIDLVEAVDGGTKSGNFVTVTTNETTFNVVAEDADGGDVREETGLVTGKTFEWNDTEGIKTLKITASSGIVCAITLADKSTAETGAEYLMQLQVAAGNLILSFLDQQYDVDVTFRTYRKQAAPLTQNNITIQNDGTVDTLTIKDQLVFENIKDVTGDQTIVEFDTSRGKLLRVDSKLTKPTWGYAVTDTNGKLIKGESAFLAGNTLQPLGLIEGDIIFYIFTVKNSELEVTTITTKDCGIAKGVSTTLSAASIYINYWNAVLNTSDKYKDYIASKNIIEVAKVDQCPSRYYLQWRDRYGSMMMQSFNPTIQYKQDFSRLETKNYREVRKLSNLSIQPKWTLNTGFLSDYKYPYYESLLVSPWIKLYDTQEDCIYDVIIKTTDYTEKTYLNQDANLFNLEKEVEQTDKQNILY